MAARTVSYLFYIIVCRDRSLLGKAAVEVPTLEGVGIVKSEVDGGALVPSELFFFKITRAVDHSVQYFNS